MADLVREILVDASPATIFGYLTRADKIVEWHGTEAELDPRPGGIYRVQLAGGHQSAGRYVEVVPNALVVFTFGWDEPGTPIPPGSTTIEISLHPEGGKTRVRLVHRGLPDDAISDHGQGWRFYLDRLAVVAPGGTVGPDLGPPAS
jgi:uncharacterized protein YndB with AHSA1/START domain